LHESTPKFTKCLNPQIDTEYSKPFQPKPQEENEFMQFRPESNYQRFNMALH